MYIRISLGWLHHPFPCPTGSGSFDSLGPSFDMITEIRNEYSTVAEPVIMILGKNVPTGLSPAETCLRLKVSLMYAILSRCEAKSFLTSLGLTNAEIGIYIKLLYKHPTLFLQWLLQAMPRKR